MANEREKPDPSKPPTYREYPRDEGLEDDFDIVEMTDQQPTTVIFFGGLGEDEEAADGEPDGPHEDAP